MRYLTATAASYVGVDLHARTLFVCALDHAGTVRLARNLPARPEPFLRAVEPFRPDPLVGCECVHSWYWLADVCRGQNIPFALGHAFGIRAVHASKTKSDAHDAEVIARLLRGGNFPLAYAYPRERRGLRDLLRTRLRLVRQRAELYGHVHTARRQLNLEPVGSDVKYQSKRDGAAADIPDPHTRRGVEARLNLLAPLDAEIRRLERDVEVAAGEHYPAELAALQTIPGVGRIISLTVLLEIDTVTRFESRQQFCSYARSSRRSRSRGARSWAWATRRAATPG
jgi:transposase